MAKAGYKASTEAAVALVAATAKTVLGVQAAATFGTDLKKIRVGFDGVTASAVPVLVELCSATWATQPPTGTNNTVVTVRQTYGRLITPGFVAARNWTTEPTTLTMIDELLLSPAGGLVIYDWPLGDTPDSDASAGFALRLTAPSAVNVRAALHFERA